MSVAPVAANGKGPDGSGRKGSESVPVKVSTARVGDVPLYLEGVGAAKPRNQVTVRSQVDGKLVKINFIEGQTVKRGDVLAKIDPVIYQAQLDVALAKKGLDEALIANTRRDLARFEKVGTLAVTQQQIDTQKALVLQQEAQLRSDAANIENLNAILGYTDVVAPIDGRTGLRLVDQGNIVHASDSSGIVVVTEMQPMQVQFTLPQQQLGQVSAAMAKGTVTALALDTEGRKALDTGKLLVADNQVDQATGTVRFKAEFPNTTLQLWPGQFVNVKVLVDTLQHVVVVPTVALQRGPNGTYVYVAGSDGKVVQRPVQLAQQTDAGSVITAGVSAGEQLVTSGFTRLLDGAKITIVTEPAATGTAPSPAIPVADAAPDGGLPGASPAAATPGPDAQPGTQTSRPAGVAPPLAGQRGHKRGASAGP